MRAGFRYFADKDPSFVALIDAHGTEWTRGALDKAVNRLARAFLAAGLSPGQSIAIIAPNCAEYVIVYLAGLQAGVCVVPINWHLARSEIAFVLQDSEARAVIAHEALGQKMLTAIHESRGRAKLMIAIGEAPDYIALRDFVAPHSDAALETAATGRMMAYTSATTGRPKAVKLPHRNAQTALDRIVEANRAVGILPEDGNVHLCASMLYHSAPLGGAHVALHMGHRLVLVDRWQPELLLQLIDTRRVTTTFMVPTMFVRLLKLPEHVRSRYSAASLRFVAHGGAPCPESVKRRMLAWWGNVLWESYGATEAQGTIVSAEEWLKYPGTVGRPFAGSKVKILDDQGRQLGPHEVGLVYIVPHTGDRFEYKGDPEKTRRSYDGDFVTVGDLGYVNEDGLLFICDRSADLIITSGMNVYPAEIESLLVQHPLVTDCAVLGEPHELLGQVPKAFVQPEPRANPGPSLTAELLRFLGERLAATKTPKRIEYLAEIPRDPNGKLYKRLLRDGSTGASRSLMGS